MGRKISEEIQKQIPILYVKYCNKKKVAEELGISPSTVSKYLNLVEATPQERKPRQKITPEIIEQINLKYKDCQNMNTVAKELNISPSTVKNHLSEENLQLMKQQNDDRDALFFYIYNLFGQYTEDKPVNPWNITQMQKFRRQGMPYRGQLLTLKYFYEVTKHTTEKSNGSIGIIPFIWEESKMYYEKQAHRAEEIAAAIQKQLAQDRIAIKYNPNDYFGKKKKKTIDLNSLEE